MLILNTKNSFSFVEMMCVIAVITLLFSLLSPSLKKLMQHTYAVECQNNLKTMGMGIHSFLEENNNVLPGPSLNGQSPIYKYNEGKITRKQVGSYIADYLTVIPTGKKKSFYIKEYVCPSNEALDLKPDLFFRVTFILNASGGPFGYPSKEGKSTKPPKSIFEIASPGASSVMADADRVNTKWLKVGAAPDVPVHIGVSRNTLYFDGHVENNIGL